MYLLFFNQNLIYQKIIMEKTMLLWRPLFAERLDWTWSVS